MIMKTIAIIFFTLAVYCNSEGGRTCYECIYPEVKTKPSNFFYPICTMKDGVFDPKNKIASSPTTDWDCFIGEVDVNGEKHTLRGSILKDLDCKKKIADEIKFAFGIETSKDAVTPCRTCSSNLCNVDINNAPGTPANLLLIFFTFGISFFLMF